MFFTIHTVTSSVQSGVFAAPRHFGVETTYRLPESLTYTNFFLGVINPRLTNSFWYAALSLGREFRLNAYRQQSNHRKTEYYFRVGPGLGIAGRGTIRQSDTDYFLGLNSSAIVGAQYHFNEKTSIYLNGGGRIFWFPGLDDVGFYSVPVISIGLQFSSNPQVPPVRY